MLRWFVTLFAIALIAASATPAHAQFGGPEATAVRQGFVLPAGEARILVFRPDIAVGAQTTGGMNEPSAEWTRTARAAVIGGKLYLISFDAPKIHYYRAGLPTALAIMNSAQVVAKGK